MLKITAIADTHTRHDRVRFDERHLASDILIHGGDYTTWGNNKDSDVKAFLHWFADQPQKHKILTSGNHDFLAYKIPQEIPKYDPFGHQIH